MIPLTQIEAASALKRTQAFVSKCEVGERRIDAIELKAFASLYGVTVNDLLGEHGAQEECKTIREE